MMIVNTAILVSGVLLLLGIASSKFSTRIGMPVLVFFLGIGMLAGSEGIGGIDFENYEIANSIGSIALAMILFDGGLRTSLASVRVGWRPALTLSTIGVLLTSALTGLATVWILDVPLLHGMLLGAIVGSTDAAAVFSVLRTSGLKLPERLTATLEVESGSNDPMAVFLTLGLVQIITATSASPQALLLFFVLQFGIGALVGVGVGGVAVWIVNRINLNHPGLYPILVMSFGLLAFGLAAVADGSGFLAVYIAGIVVGNRLTVFKRGTFLFHDAVAWLNQILLFIMLGLLSFPSRLWEVSTEGFLIALVLIFVARPLSVIVSLVWFRFRLDEMIFLSWAGLKGAVPITLATFPLMAGIAGSELLFNAVFFVVLVSAIAQGWTLSAVARWFGLGEPTNPPPLTIEIDSLRRVDGVIVDYTVSATSRVAGRTLRTLALPNGVGLTLMIRNGEVIIPRGITAILPGDHIYVAMRSELKPYIDNLFESGADFVPLTSGSEFSFRQDSTAEQIRWFFNLPEPPWSTTSLESLIENIEEKDSIDLGPFMLGKVESDSVTIRVIWCQQVGQVMHKMKTQYFTATSLDGFIATEEDSLDWLFPLSDLNDSSYPAFIAEVGALAMGSATYEWLVRNAEKIAADMGTAWPYTQPTWVFSHRKLPAIAGADIRFVSGNVRQVHAEMQIAAGNKNIWIVGGGDLASQFFDAGLLDELIIQIGSVTLGKGKPLFPRRVLSPVLRLVSVRQMGTGMVELHYEVQKDVK